jgi:RNA polymerase sigma factor (sigma-70 family)
MMLEAAYNSSTMLRQGLFHLESDSSAHRDPVELFFLCAADREDTAVWSEFLRRYACKIKYFIRGTLRRISGSALDPGVTTVRCSVQESDLLQNTILRLVENDCAAMKRFSGTTEGELLAYLAVISRSVVMDAMRRHRAFRRHAFAFAGRPGNHAEDSLRARDVADNSDLERELLGRELVSLTQRTMRNLSGPDLSRDRLVVELYFSHGLSLQQIAQCKGINLTKGGVEKLLNRVVMRVRTLASAGRSEASCDEK